MQKLGNYLLRNSAHSGIVAVVAVLLAAYGWPVTFIALLMVAINTLCRGPLHGLSVLAWLAAPAIALIYTGHYIDASSILVHGVLLWAMAAVLQRTHRWSYLVCGITVFAALIIVAANLLHPNLAAFWQNLLNANLMPILQSNGIATAQAELKTMITRMVPYASGIFLASNFSWLLILLGLARWWQTVLEKNLALVAEFRALRLHPLFVLVCIAVAVLGALQIWHVADLLALTIFPLLVAGIAMANWWVGVARHVAYSVLLFVVYISFFFYPPLPIAVFALIAIVDSVMNLRLRLRDKGAL